ARWALGGFRFYGRVGLTGLTIGYFGEFQIVFGEQREHALLCGQRFFFSGAAFLGDSPKFPDLLDDAGVNQSILRWPPRIPTIQPGYMVLPPDSAFVDVTTMGFSSRLMSFAY